MAFVEIEKKVLYKKKASIVRASMNKRQVRVYISFDIIEKLTFKVGDSVYLLVNNANKFNFLISKTIKSHSKYTIIKNSGLFYVIMINSELLDFCIDNRSHEIAYKISIDGLSITFKEFK